MFICVQCRASSDEATAFCVECGADMRSAAGASPSSAPAVPALPPSPPALSGEFLLVLNNAGIPPPLAGQHFSLDLEFTNRQNVNFQTVMVEAQSACLRYDGGINDFSLPSGGSAHFAANFTAARPSLGTPLDIRITVVDTHGIVCVYRPEERFRIPVLADASERPRGLKITVEAKDGGLARLNWEKDIDPGQVEEIHIKSDGGLARADLGEMATRRQSGIQTGGGEKLTIRLAIDPAASVSAEAAIRQEQTIAGDAGTWGFVSRVAIADFSARSWLVVQGSQEAIVFRGGQALDGLGPGCHPLAAESLPLAREQAGLGPGQPLAFGGDVYFVSKAAELPVKWGTSSKVMFIEPESGLPLEIGASGEMRLRAADARLLLSRVVGAGASPAPEEWGRMFRGILMGPVKAALVRAIKSLDISIFGIDEHLDRLSAALREELAPIFVEYGAVLEAFDVTTVVRPDGNREYEDLKKVHNSRYVDVQRAKIRQQTSLIDHQTEVQKEILSASVDTGVPLGPPGSGGFPPPLPADAQAVWFAAIAGRREGPFDNAGLKLAIRAGNIGPETLVWREGMAGWEKIADQPALAGLLAALPPPLP